MRGGIGGIGGRGETPHVSSSCLFSSLLSLCSISLFLPVCLCFSLWVCVVLPGSEVLSNEADVLLRGETEVHSGDVGDALPVGGEEHVQRDALLLQLAHAEGEV